MFEDKRTRRRRRLVVAVVFLVLAGAAFGIGYFLNINDGENVLLTEDNTKTNLKIPDSLINPSPQKTGLEQVNADSIIGLTANAPGIELTTPNTVKSFKTYFTICGHTLEKTAPVTADEVNLSELQLRAKYQDWEMTSFTPERAEFTRKIETLCPKHYIIGTDSGYISIFVYNENGEKVMKERTDIPVSTLTPEDQKSLDSGIIADTQDDLEQKLEGFSE
ncbi:MAG: BofC C-terminal domain-containing protein [Caulobacteraceae bacterium]